MSICMYIHIYVYIQHIYIHTYISVLTVLTAFLAPTLGLLGVE